MTTSLSALRLLYRFPPTAQEVAREEAEFRAGLKKMTERERSELFLLSFLGMIMQ